MAFSTRLGVRTSPSLSGSSPIRTSISRTSSSYEASFSADSGRFFIKLTGFILSPSAGSLNRNTDSRLRFGSAGILKRIVGRLFDPYSFEMSESKLRLQNIENRDRQ